MSRSAGPDPAVPGSPAWRAVTITPVECLGRVAAVLAAVASDRGEE
jgi:hypothetical protein